MMTSDIRWVLAIVAALAPWGCDCAAAPNPAGAACEVASPATACGQSCDRASPCPAGFYCGADRACTADCDGTVACPSGQACSLDGQCVSEAPDGAPADAPAVDAPTICADVTLEATPVTPNVILIVDQSGSMTAGFAGGTRWNVLRDSLMATPAGLVFDMQSQVRFGLALYSARSADPISACPIITSVPAAIGNHAAIDAVYAAESPIEDTPTGDAIDAVLNGLLMVPDPSPDPTIFILATDGEPDRCEELDPQRGQAEAIAAAQRAFSLGIRLYIISVGSGVVSATHLQDMANAGLGVAAGAPDAPFWVAGDDAGLRGALRTIVGGVLSCDVTLRGRVDVTMACTGAVLLNGRPIPCDDPNGWRVVDESHIELVGDACTELTSSAGATLVARFPCDVVLI